jgi:hypothetical protein
MTYRFSPITTKEQFKSALAYTSEQLVQLAETVLQKSLRPDTLKIFAHYYDEYDTLRDLLSHYGPKSSISSETSLYVDSSEEVNDDLIKWLGIRVVDPYRAQVGCGDYAANYSEIAERYLGKTTYVRKVDHALTMLEIWHPDFDVLGYVVKD